MNKDKMLNIAGLCTTILGAVATIAGSIIADKKLDSKIAEEVSKAVAEVKD